jgi:hypothetical protein
MSRPAQSEDQISALSDWTAAEEIVAVFTLAGSGYLIVFNEGAWNHHYWHFPLLPAVALALTMLAVRVRAWVRADGGGTKRGRLRVALAMVLVVEIIASSAYSLYRRHTRESGYCVEAVALMREGNL